MTRPAVPTVARVAVALAATAGIVAASWVIWWTPLGDRLRHHSDQVGDQVRRLAVDHPVGAVAGFLAVYVALASLALPVWWMQVLAGIAWGLWRGGGIGLAGSCVGAVAGASLARWLAGDFFHRRVEPRLGRLRQLDRTLGHNGFLVVTVARLTHFLPFGLSNYAFGLLDISLRDIALGTLLGNVPALGLYVGIGAGLAGDWRFDAALGAVNVLMLVPLVTRYLRPEWFRRWGIE